MRKEFKLELVTFNDSLMTLSNEQSALSCDNGMLIAHSHNPLQNLYNYLDIVVIILEYNTLRKGALGQRGQVGP